MSRVANSLFAQDTTELDLTNPQQQVRGTGLIGQGSVCRGMFLHLLTAFTPDGTPLRIVWNKVIVRKDETPEAKALKKKRGKTSTGG